MGIQQTLGQVAGQLKELQSSVTGISRIVQRYEEILNSHRATDQSRVKDRSFECPDPKYTSLQICLAGEREPALDRSIVLTPLDRIFDQVMGLCASDQMTLHNTTFFASTLRSLLKCRV